MFSKDNKNVLTWGTFDILHAGHIEFLTEAKRLGKVHVIVLPDSAVVENKKRNPVHPETLRQRNLIDTGLVEKAYIDSLESGLSSIKGLRPDYFVVGFDQNTKWETYLVDFCKRNEIRISFVRMFQERAGGVHSRHLRKD